MDGADYYYEVRNRFNTDKSPLDFLFLNRSCFNGLIRFNKKGGFNVPFGHKPQCFSKAYISKIVNQVDRVYKLAKLSDWTFLHQDFRKTMSSATELDFITVTHHMQDVIPIILIVGTEQTKKCYIKDSKRLRQVLSFQPGIVTSIEKTLPFPPIGSEFNVITR